MKTIKKINIDLPKDILSIKDGFIDNDKKLFLVGGAIRDSLLNIKPKDFDLATDAKPEEVKRICNELGFKTLETGKHFGVINVIGDDDIFEIATFRSDSINSDGRRPDSITFTTIDEDVKRRDLSINALFFDIETNEVIDLVGGINDLKNNLIRTVGNAKDRFEEDKLRKLRVLRFVSRFDGQLDGDIISALKTNNTLNGVSNERIRDEFLKGLKTALKPVNFLSLFIEFDMFKFIFDDLEINRFFIKDDRDPIVVISRLLMFNDSPNVKKVLNLKKFTKEEIKMILFLIDMSVLNLGSVIKLKQTQNTLINITDEQIKKICRHVDKKIVDRFIEFKLTVTGEYAFKSGIKKGPDVGKFILKEELINFNKGLKK
jgi:tRNA nucleotidyltransferase/poly(A) polymerase